MFGRRDERAAIEWARFVDHAAQERLTIVTVRDVYQCAQHGTKAVITLYGEAQVHDAWFWWDRVTAGATLAVAMSSGYGPHSHREGVIYIGSQTNGSGVYDALSAKTLRRAQRHHLRLAAQQRREEKRTTPTTSRVSA